LGSLEAFDKTLTMVVVIKHVTYSLASLTFSLFIVTLVSVLPAILLGIVSMCRAFALGAGALDAGL
jgi:hypothetical protein